MADYKIYRNGEYVGTETREGGSGYPTRIETVDHDGNRVVKVKKEWASDYSDSGSSDSESSSVVPSDEDEGMGFTFAIIATILMIVLVALPENIDTTIFLGLLGGWFVCMFLSLFGGVNAISFAISFSILGAIFADLVC